MSTKETPVVTFDGKLPPKQRRFVDEYLIDLNAFGAAVRSGYSPETAGCIAYRLLQKPEVSAAIQRAMSERSERTKITADTILRDLDEMRRANLKDCLDENGRYKPFPEWPDALARMVVGIELEQKCQREGDAMVAVAHILKVRFSDRLRILELIGRHVNVRAFTPAIEAQNVFVDFEERFQAGLARARKIADVNGSEQQTH